MTPGVGGRSGGLGTGGMNHKHLMAMSRVVAATSVALFILRALYNDSHESCAGEGRSEATTAGTEKDEVRLILGVFGNLEVQVVAHVLRALKGMVFPAGEWLAR